MIFYLRHWSHNWIMGTIYTLDDLASLSLFLMLSGHLL